jgi:CBS domain-containing protein
VVDPAGDLVGIVTRRDLVNGIASGLPLEDITEPEVICASPTDTVAGALQLMLEEDVDHLPVVDGARLVGMCTRTDVLHTRRHVIEHEQAQHGWLDRRRPDRT